MGEHKANIDEPKRLLVRLQFPIHEPMVVEADLTAGFLERVWKLMLICQKIRRTMHGRGKSDHRGCPCHYVSILSEAPIERLLAMAKVKEWRHLQCIWIPDGFFFSASWVSAA